MDPTIIAAAAGVAGWLSGVVGAFFAIRTELRWLRADVNRAHARIDRIAGIGDGYGTSASG